MSLFRRSAAPVIEPEQDEVVTFFCYSCFMDFSDYETDDVKCRRCGSVNVEVDRELSS